MKTFNFVAVRATQAPGKQVFAFAAEPKDVLTFATVEGVKRHDDGSLAGFQRHQIASHIKEIRSYLQREDALLPNAVVIAFIEGARVTDLGDGTVSVEISVEEGNPPGYVVDGQQRLTALSGMEKPGFQVFVSALICSDYNELRQQFVQAARGNSDAETLADLFLSTPQGQTPAALIGDTPTHVLARNAAWWWLKKLAAIVMAAVLRNTSDADRAACPKDLLPFLEDDIERLNATLLSRALSRTPGSANASDAPSKRARESAGSQQAKRPSRNLPVGARRQVTAVRPQQRQQMPTPPAPPLPLPTLPGAPGAIICRRCGGRGHIERDCPSKR